MIRFSQQFRSRSCRVFFGIICAAIVASTTALAQSSRPGWGATPYADGLGTGVTFRVWAPNATSATVPGQMNNFNTSATPLVKELTNGVWNGVWSVDVAGVTNLTQYKFYFNGNLWKQDPRARLVQYSGSGGNSIVYNPNTFNWAGDNFTNPPQKDLFLYEMHPGTFYTVGGSPLVAATNKLDYLKSLGINAVEVMPVAEFPGTSSWGYNPAQLFAVENQGFGGPDAFKTFIKACHARGMAVLLDVVHNHYGTGDLEMWNFDGYAGVPVTAANGGGIYFYQSNSNLQVTPYGATRPNVSSNQVANFIQDNTTMWLSEYHVDGLRWDDPYTLTHDYVGNYIATAGNLLQGINNITHTNYTGKISIAEDVYNTWGYDSSWDTGYAYYFIPILTNTADSSRNMNNVSYAILNAVSYSAGSSLKRIQYLESHDVVGDLNGSTHVRVPTAIDPTTPNSYRARKLSTLGAIVTLTAPGIPMIFQGQEMLENQQFSSSRLVDWSKTTTYNRIVQLYRDLISARRNLNGYTPGLEGDQCSVIWNDNSSKLIAFHRWNSAAPSQDAMVIANFANINYPVYNLTFPSAGTWYVHFNSDLTNYSSDFGNNGSTVVTVGGNLQGSVAIGPYSALILSQTPEGPPVVSVTPQNLVVFAGSNGVFTANAGGFPPLSYQWQNVSGSIAGATNSTLSFVNAQLTNAGNYFVVVTNLFGAVTSSVVTLTVNVTAQYAASPTNGPVPLSVQFNGPSTDSGGNTITQWNWNFGDGSTSTLQSPMHIFNTVSNFTPGLLVTNNLGTSITASGSKITVSLPTVQFTASPASGFAPLNVQFTAPAVDSGGNSLTSWNWNFGDGATSTAQNPTHLFNTANNFAPGLVATNSLGLKIIGTGPAITATFNSGLIVNGGFETGNFAGWTLTGDIIDAIVDNGQNSQIPPHSGNFAAALYTATAHNFGYLSQTLATVPGTSYLLSCWLNHSGGDPGDIFMVSWNGTNLFSQTNPPATAWTNLQFIVSAIGASSVLQLGYAANGNDYLGLDDVSVLAILPPAQPVLTGISLSGNNLVINGTNGVSGLTYTVLSSTNLTLPWNQWVPVTTNVLSANGNFTITATNAVNTNIPQSYYILQQTGP